MRCPSCKILLLSLFLGIGIQALAIPISPQGLLSLVEQSDLVVTTFVFHTRTLDGFSTTPDSYAILEIQEVHKGVADKDTVKVSYSVYLECPAPARYQHGTTVLAFLSWVPELDSYVTEGLSYGLKDVPKADRVVYETRIRELLRLMTLESPEQRETAKLEWLMDCLRDPVTRKDAVFDLLPSDTIDRQEPALAKTLSRAQHAEVLNILTTYTTASELSPWDVIGLMTIVAIGTPHLDISVWEQKLWALDFSAPDLTAHTLEILTDFLHTAEHPPSP